jgi:hypothetical protein
LRSGPDYDNKMNLVQNCTADGCITKQNNSTRSCVVRCSDAWMIIRVQRIRQAFFSIIARS